VTILRLQIPSGHLRFNLVAYTAAISSCEKDSWTNAEENRPTIGS
jgi:hypothetical protein